MKVNACLEGEATRIGKNPFLILLFVEKRKTIAIMVVTTSHQS